MSSKIIQILLNNADLSGVKIADLSNSVARVYLIPRGMMDYAKSRPDLASPSLYMLFDDERTTVYIGESENFNDRIISHLINKSFWKWPVVCVATGSGLDKADVKFFESHAISKATEIGRFEVQSKTSPLKNNLHEFKHAAALNLFEDFELLITTIGFNIFEPRKEVFPETEQLPKSAPKKEDDIREFDTIICPSTGEGRVDAFENKSAWWAVRISQANMGKLKDIGLYEGSPVSGIQYYAKITRIEPYPEKPGKYIIHHDGNIQELANPLWIGQHPELALYGPRYYKLEDILRSRTLAELTDITYGSDYQNRTKVPLSTR